jgi:hypothetical protein
MRSRIQPDNQFSTMHSYRSSNLNLTKMKMNTDILHRNIVLFDKHIGDLLHHIHNLTMMNFQSETHRQAEMKNWGWDFQCTNSNILYEVINMIPEYQEFDYPQRAHSHNSHSTKSSLPTPLVDALKSGYLDIRTVMDSDSDFLTPSSTENSFAFERNRSSAI